MCDRQAATIKNCCSDEAHYWELVSELLELRCATAQAVGREQYAYAVIDSAVESGHYDTMQRALHEYRQLDADLQQRVAAAASNMS